MTTNYLNPKIIHLDRVDFEKLDISPGTSKFLDSDFAILNAGHIFDLSIIVDRDNEQLIKSCSGLKFSNTQHQTKFAEDVSGISTITGISDNGLTQSNKIMHENILNSNLDFESTIKGILFAKMVSIIFNVSDSEIAALDFTNDAQRDSQIFFDNDSTANVPNDIKLKTVGLDVSGNFDVSGIAVFNQTITNWFTDVSGHSIMDSEVSYWNTRTEQDSSGNETESVLFNQSDKIMVMYAVSTSFIQGDHDSGIYKISIDNLTAFRTETESPIDAGLELASGIADSNYVTRFILEYMWGVGEPEPEPEPEALYPEPEPQPESEPEPEPESQHQPESEPEPEPESQHQPELSYQIAFRINASQAGGQPHILQLGQIEFYTQEGAEQAAAMEVPEHAACPFKIGGASGFKEEPIWDKDNPRQYERLEDNDTGTISITVSSNITDTRTGPMEWFHHGNGGTKKVSYLFDSGTTLGKTGETDASGSGTANKFVANIKHYDFGDSFSPQTYEEVLDASGVGVILYFTFTGCGEPVYYRWWTANDNGQWGRLLTSWTTICDWNNNEKTYTLSGEAHPDLLDAQGWGDNGWPNNFYIYPGATNSDGTRYAYSANPSDTSNAEQFGNYYFYSLLP